MPPPHHPSPFSPSLEKWITLEKRILVGDHAPVTLPMGIINLILFLLFHLSLSVYSSQPSEGRGDINHYSYRTFLINTTPQLWRNHREEMRNTPTRKVWNPERAAPTLL
jgi:hypothetical protein